MLENLPRRLTEIFEEIAFGNNLTSPEQNLMVSMIFEESTEWCKGLVTDTEIVIIEAIFKHALAEREARRNS